MKCINAAEGDASPNEPSAQGKLQKQQNLQNPQNLQKPLKPLKPLKPQQPKKPKKERLDVLLVTQGHFSSREKAKATIMAGMVFVDGEKVDKAGTMVNPEGEIFVKQKDFPYVSRGGLKLEKSMELWPIDLKGAVCVDIGASTGGFTDCMLQKGAAKVYAIDVGYGQLDYKLRQDSRVVNMEKCNVRYLPEDAISERVDFISVDVSFISLKLILPVAKRLLADSGSMVCLVKPQFEAGKEQVGKNGIVRDKNVHLNVIKNVVGYAEENGLSPIGLTYSPVKGAKGNIEYLIYLSGLTGVLSEEQMMNVVNASHEEL